MINIYSVGGSVRDEIMGLPSKDLDFSVEASSYNEMLDYIISNGGEIFLEKPEYLTVRAKLNNECADFVLCRKDGAYYDGRHPDKVKIGTIYDDLARRDFTMNAIAKCANGSYIDPHNGIEDIKDNRIRCVGSAKARLTEDFLRAIRAIRFAITKNMYLDTEIDYILSDIESCKLIATISIERIREELTKCFRANTLLTLQYLEAYNNLRDVIFKNSELWLKPTLEKI